jgi:hypothetical protein
MQDTGSYIGQATSYCVWSTERLPALTAAAAAAAAVGKLAAAVDNLAGAVDTLAEAVGKQATLPVHARHRL